MNSIIAMLQEFSQKNQQTINKLIAQTILANININNFANLNLTVLAKQSYTSTASIIRFCKKLGFSGYSEFKFTFLKVLQQNQQSKPLKICFSCNNFWQQMEQILLLFNNEQQGLIKNYLRQNLPLYLLVSESNKNNLLVFIKKLTRIFSNIEFKVLESRDVTTFKKTKPLVLGLIAELPKWFYQQDYQFISLFKKLNPNLNINEEQFIFLLAKFFCDFNN